MSASVRMAPHPPLSPPSSSSSNSTAAAIEYVICSGSGQRFTVDHLFPHLPDHKKVEGYGRKLKTLAELLSKWRDVVKVERRGPGKTWVTGLISQVQIIAACKRLADAAYVPDPGT